MLKVIITGATGMVGEGVMHICLENPDVEKVLIINRKPSGYSHPKLQEIVHPDLSDISSLKDKVSGYNACYFCLGITSVGTPAEKYYGVTYSLTLGFAKTLREVNQEMTFCYVSGSGTDRTEKGRIRWARVKGKTENDLLRLGFAQMFGFRPGFIKPIPGLQHTHTFYKFINWMFPIGRALSPNGFCTLEELGKAMIKVAQNGFPSNIVHGKDIISLAR
jgi:uncharacterized protein YbjT (DUF2867 family)